jgi:hypothetical protein
MRLVTLLVCLVASCVAGGPANSEAQRYVWKDMDCRQSRIVAWSGFKCRATDVVTTEGNIGAFRQWAAFGTNRDGYYAHIFLWEAENTFSYVPADSTTAEFLKWMFEHGTSIAQVSAVIRYKDADYVTFNDSKDGRNCTGFRRLGQFQRGGYDSVTGGILCAPSGKTIAVDDISIFIDNVRLQAPKTGF